MKRKNTMRVLWTIICVMVILSMVMWTVAIGF